MKLGYNYAGHPDTKGNNMKITASQLRRLIRETVEEVQSEMDEHGDVVSPEEFEMIVTESAIRLRLNEDFGLLTVTLGTVIGILAYKAGKKILGSAANAAAHVAYDLSAAAQAELRRKAAAAKQANFDAAVESLADDPELASMFEELKALRVSGSSKQVSDLSKQITAYVKANMAQTGAPSMDVRTALSKRAGAAVKR